MAHQRRGAPALIEWDEKQMMKEIRLFAKGEMKSVGGVRKNRVVRQEKRDWDTLITRSVASAARQEQIRADRVAAAARALRFFGGHRSPLSGSASGAFSGSGSGSEGSASPSVVGNDDDDDDGFVARGGTMSPFWADGGGGDDDDDDDEEVPSAEEDNGEEEEEEEEEEEIVVPRRRRARPVPGRARGRPQGSGTTVVLRRPTTENAWWSVPADIFAAAKKKEQYRYTAVGRAMELGSRKTPACAECVRRGTQQDILDCKSIGGGRCGRCLWARVPLDKGCPKP